MEEELLSRYQKLSSKLLKDQQSYCRKEMVKKKDFMFIPS